MPEKTELETSKPLDPNAPGGDLRLHPLRTLRDDYFMAALHGIIAAQPVRHNMGQEQDITRNVALAFSYADKAMKMRSDKAPST